MNDAGNVVPLFKRRLNTALVMEKDGCRAVFTTIGHDYKKTIIVKTIMKPESVIRAEVPSLGLAVNRALHKGAGLFVTTKVVVPECIICNVGSELRTFMRKLEDDDSVILEEVV